jgi:tricarballylate dehydrogenase
VNDRAMALMNGGERSQNIFAAGEIMAGNILGMGYAAGIGVTIGTVFGRIAGREAAMQALHPAKSQVTVKEVATHAAD